MEEKDRKKSDKKERSLLILNHLKLLEVPICADREIKTENCIQQRIKQRLVVITKIKERKNDKQ